MATYLAKRKLFSIWAVHCHVYGKPQRKQETGLLISSLVHAFGSHVSNVSNTDSSPGFLISHGCEFFKSDLINIPSFKVGVLNIDHRVESPGQ